MPLSRVSFSNERRRAAVIGQRLDRDGVARLYQEHGALLVGYACALLGDRSAAEDVVHHVFTRLLHGDIAIRERPLAYLCQAV